MSVMGNTLIPMVEHECEEMYGVLRNDPQDFDQDKIREQAKKTLHALLHLYAAVGGVPKTHTLGDFNTVCRLLGISPDLVPGSRRHNPADTLMQAEAKAKAALPARRPPATGMPRGTTRR